MSLCLVGNGSRLDCSEATTRSQWCGIAGSWVCLYGVGAHSVTQPGCVCVSRRRRRPPTTTINRTSLDDDCDLRLATSDYLTRPRNIDLISTSFRCCSPRRRRHRHHQQHLLPQQRLVNDSRRSTVGL